ncbi:hypothetical protein [Amycolatopsis sp. NPDC059657]|uniref:phage tail protein n=1 Tax=Amycolatopsis sp. NPDC059657 TaxID=3346899 RepID=UPI0036702E68
MATVGHAYLKIMPSLQGLGRHLREQVRESERGAPSISLTAQVQTALLKEQLRAAAREGDQTAINLLAELDAIPAETRFQRLVRQLSGREVSIKVVADKTLGATVRGLGALDAGLNRTTVGFARMTVAVGASVLKYAALAAAVSQAVSVLGGLGSAAATASGALLVLPAAGLAAAAAIGTLKLGVAGFSKALKAEDPAKYAEAIKDFPPAMAAAANAVRALRPELTGLRQEVQQRLFAGLASEITGLAGIYVPLLQDGLGQIATGLNKGALGFAAFAREGRTVSDVRSILDSSAVSLTTLSAGVQPFLQGLRDIAAVGAEFLPGFATGLASGAQKFADFIAAARESGQLREWLSGGLAAVKDLFTVMGNLAKVVGAVFAAANASGGGLLSTLVEITGQMVTFVQSAEGAGALRQIFGGLHAIVTGLLPVLAAIGQAIVTSVAPAIAQLGPMIGAAFTALAPAIASLGQIFAALAPVLGTAAQALVTILVPALTALAPIVAALAPVVAQVAAAFGGALGAAITTITPALIQLARTLAPLIEGFGGLLVQALQLAAPALADLMTVLTPIIGELGGAFLQALNAVLPVISALAGIFTSVLLAALRAVMPVLPVIVQTIQKLAEVIGTALQAAAPVLTEVGALLGQIAGQVLTALLPILPPLVQAFLSIVTAVQSVIPPILELVSALLPPLLGLITSLLPIIVEGASLFASLVSAIAPLITMISTLLIPVFQALFDFLQPIFSAISGVIAGAMQYIQGVINVVLGLISGDWSRAWNGLKNMLGGIWTIIKSAVVDGIGGLLGYFASLPGRILDALGNLGALLWEAGRNIIRGLVNGLISAFGWVKDQLGNLTNWIKSWKGPPAKDKILLTANGRLIMGGLLDGLRDGEPQIRRYLTGLTDALPLDMSGTVTAAAPSAGRVDGAPALVPTSAQGPAQVTVVIDGSGLPRALAEWLRHAVRTQGGGSVQTAFGR